MATILEKAKLSLLERMLLFYGAKFPNHPRKWWIHGKLQHIFRVRLSGEFEVERNGLQWKLNPGDFEHRNLFWLGGMDKWDIHHLKKLLTAKSVFFDVGANLGYYSLVTAQALRGDCKVYAFEPNPTTRERLLWNVAANNMNHVVAVKPLALSDKPGSATLIERQDNSGAARLGTDAPGSSVKVTTLDLFCKEESIDKIDAIKIDVEGYEIKVLQGALEALTRFKPALIVEFWSVGLDRVNANEDELARLLQEIGYKLFRAERGTLVPVDNIPRGDVPVNVFAFHEQRTMHSFLELAAGGTT